MATKVAGPPPGPPNVGPLGPIQTIPPGLLGLLQLKQLGRLPDKLADTVAGVIELRDWYLTARRVDNIALFGGMMQPAAAVVTGNQGAVLLQVAGFGNCTVPQNQIWWVEQFGATAPTALAADVLSFGLGLENNANNILMPLGPISVDTVTARNRVLSAKIDRGFWAFPGDRFVLIIQDISTAGIVVTATLRATPCPI